MNLLLDLKLSVLIDKKYHAQIIKRAKKMGLSNSEYILTLLQKCDEGWFYIEKK